MNIFFKSTLCATLLLCTNVFSYAAPVLEHGTQISEKDLEAVFDRGPLKAARRPIRMRTKRF